MIHYTVGSVAAGGARERGSWCPSGPTSSPSHTRLCSQHELDISLEYARDGLGNTYCEDQNPTPGTCDDVMLRLCPVACGTCV